MNKTCSKCNLTLDLNMFVNSKLGKHGKAGQCKSCRNKKNQEYRNKNFYGITEPEYQQLLADSNNICRLCGNSGSLVVDHNHDTGKVRGMICRQCNSAIGMLHDSPVLISKVLQYMLENN